MNRYRIIRRAKALIRGDDNNPNLRGTVVFRQLDRGVLITAEIFGLPSGSGSEPHIFALHIHEGNSCEGNGNEAFPLSGGHYNPEGKPHPYHAGDLPPLFGNHGRAYMSIISDRFAVSEVVGKTVIIHDGPDDFRSQPSGNSGSKIACGIIFAI